MRTMLLSILVAMAGCGGSPVQDVVGPFTGARHLFYVTALQLPMEPGDFAADLNGDGKTDNRLDNVVGALLGTRNANQHVDELIAAAPAVVEIVTDDASVREDRTVGVRFLGGGDAAADQIGAALHDGLLRSNRVSATHSESAEVPLPLFASADPVHAHVDHWQIDLAPDGNGGFVGELDGAIPADEVVPPFYTSFMQLMSSAQPPQDFVHFFDADRDGQIPLAEFAHDGLIANLAAPDIQVGVAANTMKDHFSIGIGLTLAPCLDDACTRATPPPSCFDRVRNGDESDVDCGGSCGPCGGGAHCAAASDCVTQACDAGSCRAPSCSDAIRDGFEVDIDCGPGCGKCQLNATCYEDGDCASGNCATIVNTTTKICAPKTP